MMAHLTLSGTTTGTLDVSKGPVSGSLMAGISTSDLPILEGLPRALLYELSHLASAHDYRST